MKQDKAIAVLYHKNCPDGFAAGWIAWKKFGNKADFFAVDPREIPKIIFNYKVVYALDTSIDMVDMARFKKKKIKTIVLDHHKSTEKNVKCADEFRYSSEHSGATLSWEYFFPKLKMPEFIKRIEDLDLWRFNLSHTKELDAYCELVPYDDFKLLDSVIKKFENRKTRKAIIQIGKIIVRYQDFLVARLVNNAELVRFEKINAYAVNSPLFNSFVGDVLRKKFPPIGIIWFEKEGMRFVSLRSDGVIDVSKIAGKYGGGGHKAAAGFSMSASDPLPWKRLKL